VRTFWEERHLYKNIILKKNLKTVSFLSRCYLGRFFNLTLIVLVKLLNVLVKGSQEPAFNANFHSDTEYFQNTLNTIRN